MSIQVGDGFGVNMTYMGKRITGCCARPMPNHPNPEKKKQHFDTANSPKKYGNSKHAITKNMIAASVDV